MQVKHRTYNPHPMWNNLATILFTMEEDGWVLSHIVPVNEYESVAVFMRPDPEAKEPEAVEPGSYL